MSTILKSISLGTTLGLFSFGIYSFPTPVENLDLIPLEEGITFPENVQTIITEKCTGCHKPDARNEKVREKLQ